MLVLVNFLPVINLVCQLLFDGCVACVDATTAKRLPGKLKRPASLSKAAPPRVQAKATGATAASASADVSGANLTAQQLRAFRRKRREAVGDAPEHASFSARARRLGQRVVAHLGPAPAPVERERLLAKTEPFIPPAEPETWA